MLLNVYFAKQLLHIQKNIRVRLMSLTSILDEWDPSLSLNNDTIGYQIDYIEDRGSKPSLQSVSFKAVSGRVEWFFKSMEIADLLKKTKNI